MFGEALEHDFHHTWFAETSVNGTSGRHNWVAGGAVQRDLYRSDDLPEFDYTYTVPSVFAQLESPWTERLAFSLSARWDAHSEYGSFVSPRASALIRAAEQWSLRLTAGGGYFAPTPFTEETEEVGLSRALRLDGIEAERARGASADLGGTIGRVEINASIFASFIDDALAVRATPAGCCGTRAWPTGRRTTPPRRRRSWPVTS